MKVSFFIPVYFREDIVKKSMESLLKTTKGSKHKLTFNIIDNKSNDSLREYLKSIAKSDNRINLSLLDKNYGKAVAVMNCCNRYPDFELFVNFDSDLVCLQDGWADELIDSFLLIDKAGMVSVNYINNGNNPMPKQPKSDMLDNKNTFNFGGDVAGGCFITSKDVWVKSGGYIASGLYGGVDGYFRYRVTQLGYKCGYIEEILVEHPNDHESDYYKWKVAVQKNIGKMGFHAPAERLGNAKGFFDK